MLTLDGVLAEGVPVYALTRQQKIEALRQLLRFDISRVIRHGVVGPSNHGLALAGSYMPHMWSVPCANMLTPLEVYQHHLDDALRRRKNLGKCESVSDLRKALSTYSGAQKVSNFRPSAALALYNRYLPKEGGSVYDPSAGYGGRLVGALCCPRVKRYVGVDPCTKTMVGLRDMERELPDIVRWCGYQPPEIELVPNTGSEDYRLVPESFEMVLTSPPYSGHERYSDEETQSWVKYKTNEEWVNGFMADTLRNCHKGLKRSGVLVLNIADCSTYTTLTKDVLAVAAKCGFKLKETLKLALQASPGTRKDGEYKYEPVYVFGKGTGKLTKRTRCITQHGVSPSTVYHPARCRVNSYS
jgi:hypothetical protein